MAHHQTRNGGTGTNHQHHLHDDSTNVYFTVGGRLETATYRADQVTDAELKELFRCAAEAGPLDIVKLRKDEKLLNISTRLPANSPDTAYVLEVVGAHPTSVGMIEAEVLRALEVRVAALERELQHHQEAACTAPSLALRDLIRQVDNFRNKLETTEHLSWLGFYKQLPEPISSEACRRLQYRRKSDSVKRRVREKFLNICDVAVSSSAREWLRSPAFDTRQWEDEELLLMLQTMFAELELPQRFNIPMSTLRNFLYEVYNNYNEVPFHNFRHCFCVAQMMYAVVWAADLPRRIGDLEVLILIVSCICHDLDHPGYNNIYQINARTELALRYNDISPLENHHCSVAFRVLEAPECNVFAALDSTTYRTVREGIIRCILATDMARHNEILGQFTDIVPEFDYANKAHVNLLTMILIKVADISNEARPMDVAESWLDRLLQEFFKQSDAEKLEGLPVTPFMDRDKVTKPSSECSFIGLVLLPLFETLGELFPELQELIVRPAREALEYYRRLNEAAKDERHQRKSIVDMGESTGSATLASITATGQTTAVAAADAAASAAAAAAAVVRSTSSQSVRSKRSAGTVNSRSRSTEDEVTENLTIEETEILESSDPETATEVEVSERALKFKISTEGTVVGPPIGRRSCPGSRKGSREKSSLDYQNHELARVIREKEREIFRRGRPDDRWADKGENGENGDSSESSDASRILEEYDRVGGGVGGGAVLVAEDGRRPTVTRATRCCCDDKSSTVSHKSFLSRLRNFTDRLSMSFDTKDASVPAKASKHTSSSVPKIRNKSNSIVDDRSTTVCKRCNMSKPTSRREPRCTAVPKSTTELSNVVDKRAMTLPKAKRCENAGRNKSWRAVFVKEKRSSASLEALPAVGREAATATLPKHRRYSSNPEGKAPSGVGDVARVEFHEIVLLPGAGKPAIVVDPEESNYPGPVAECLDDIGKVEIRRSSASMEDISKITMQTGTTLLGGSLEQKKKTDEYQHTAGSLDSMLCKESRKIPKKPIFPSPVSTKKSSPSLFSRFKSGMSIDGARSSGGGGGGGSGSGNGNGNGNGHSYSGSLHDQQQQQQQQQQPQSGWISSLTASLRSKKQTGESNWQPQPSRPESSREEIE